MKSSLLEIDSLLYTLKSKVVLRHINFRVETGDILLILGRNGAGKSTLFKSIFGTIKPDQRFVRIDGIVKANPFEIENGISYSTHYCHLPENKTVKQLIDLYINDQNTKELLYKNEVLVYILNQKLKELSFGIKSYVQTLLYLYDSSKFCLLDEPFASLSPLLAEKILDLIVVQSKSKGIIISDHQFENVFEVATKKYVLSKGKLIPVENRNDLIESGYINQ